jgi:hypothetical protein
VVETSIDIIRNLVIELTLDVLVSLTEVRNTIRSLQLTKAAGSVQINNRLLKKLPKKAIVYLTHIMNACFKYSYFPTAWNQADPFDPKSYTPISLSTSHQLLRMTKHIASGLAAKLSTGMLLLDVEKAFDCVWHDALLH